MLPLKNETCKKMTMIFFVCSVCPIMLLMISSFSDFRAIASFLHLTNMNPAFFYYPSCLFSGISLIFSTGVRSKILNRFVAFIHFSCVYWVVLFFLGFGSIGRLDWLIALIAYVGLCNWLLKTNNQKSVASICLGIPMLFSIGLFLKVNYDLFTSTIGFATIGYVIFLTLSGLVGLILTTHLPNKNTKIKWVLLGLNYFFAIYFHFVLIFELLLR